MRAQNDLIIGTKTTSGSAVGIATNANIIGIPQWSNGIVRASFQAVVTGSTATGTLQLQVSNDIPIGLPANQFVPTNWTNLGTSVAVAAAGVFFVPAIASNVGYIETCYEYMRVNWTDGSSGANTGTVICRMKSDGF